MDQNRQVPGYVANTGEICALTRTLFQPGIVIASPSTIDPNYVYTWVRDSSLVFKVIADQFTLGYDTSLRGQIDNFLAAEASLQYVCNPSGSVSTGGLGEPKFNIDGTPFGLGWGRPQRGLHIVLYPTLRAQRNPC